MGSHLSSKPPKGPASLAAIPPQDDAFLKALPLTHDFMTMLSYEDGTPRQLATLTVFVDDGSWKVWLNDRDNQRSLCVSGQGFQEALRMLEAALGSERPSWRQARPQQGRKGK